MFTKDITGWQWKVLGDGGSTRQEKPGAADLRLAGPLQAAAGLG